LIAGGFDLCTFFRDGVKKKHRAMGDLERSVIVAGLITMTTPARAAGDYQKDQLRIENRFAD
jgi:hypothetical protein